MPLNQKVYNGAWPAYFSATTQYAFDTTGSSLTYNQMYNNAMQLQSSIPLQTNLFGFSNLASPAFMKGTN
jgi:hypothetical protein